MSEEPRRRAALRKQRESFFAKMMVFCFMAAAISSGLVAYNTSRLILRDGNNITAYIPSTLLTDAPGSALVMLTDDGGNPLSGQPVTIEVSKDGNVIWTGTDLTDSGGLVTPTLSGLTMTGEAKVTIRGGGEVLSKIVTIETTTRIFLQTDKPSTSQARLSTYGPWRSPGQLPPFRRKMSCLKSPLRRATGYSGRP